VKNGAARESSCIRIESYLLLEKSVGGQTCQFWQVEEFSFSGKIDEQSELSDPLKPCQNQNQKKLLGGAIGARISKPQGVNSIKSLGSSRLFFSLLELFFDQ